MVLAEQLIVNLRGATQCKSKTIYIYRRNTNSSAIVSLMSSQDTEITERLNDLTDNPESIFKIYNVRLKELLNKTVQRDSFLSVMCEEMDLSEVFLSSSQGLKIIPVDEYDKYIQDSAKLFYELHDTANKKFNDLVLIYMSIILSHLLSERFQKLPDEKKYDDLFKQHNKCFVETRDFYFNKVLGSISDNAEKWFSIQEHYKHSRCKEKIELLESCNKDTVEIFTFLEKDKKKWTESESNLFKYHTDKYCKIKIKFQRFRSYWNNISNSIFRTGVCYLFGSFLVPAIHNNTCSVEDLDRYNKLFSDNKILTIEFDAQLKQFEDYNVLSEVFKKINLQILFDKELNRIEKQCVKKRKRSSELIVHDVESSDVTIGNIQNTIEMIETMSAMGAVVETKNNEVDEIIIVKNTADNSQCMIMDDKDKTLAAGDVGNCDNNDNDNDNNKKDDNNHTLAEYDNTLPLGHGDDIDNDDDDDDDEQYYEEIVQYLTDYRFVEKYLRDINEDQTVTIDSFLKSNYPLLTARHISEKFLYSTISERFKFQIQYNDLRKLTKDNWLGDNNINLMAEIINFIFFCLSDLNNNPTVHCWNTFLYSKLFTHGVFDYNFVKRWTKRIKTFEFKKFLIPININNNHWTLICCILTLSTRTIEISYYDSFGPHPTASDKYCTAAKEWFKCELKAKKIKHDFTYILNDKSIIQQFDGNNCGLVVIQNMINLAFNKDIKIYNNQDEIKSLRSLITYISLDSGMDSLKLFEGIDLSKIESIMNYQRSHSFTTLKAIHPPTVSVDSMSIDNSSSSAEDRLKKYKNDDDDESFQEYLQIMTTLMKKFG